MWGGDMRADAQQGQQEEGIRFPGTGCGCILKWVLATEYEASTRPVCAPTTEPTFQPLDG